MIGFAVILFNVLLAFGAPLIATQDPLKIDTKNIASPPSQINFFGTDGMGRDIFSRVGRWVDMIIMRLMDAVMSFPAILLAIGFIAVRGGSLYNVVIALSVVYTPVFYRISRGSILSLKEKAFVEAARAAGNSSSIIIARHILPNCMAPIIVQITVSLAYAIIAEASLSFLGLGAPPPAPSWGNILSDARDFMMDAPWMTVFPGIAITLSVVGFNMFGDALRDILDPRLK
jgi:peptide/nickel transport system permease protein